METLKNRKTWNNNLDKFEEKLQLDYWYFQGSLLLYGNCQPKNEKS